MRKTLTTAITLVCFGVFMTAAHDADAAPVLLNPPTRTTCIPASFPLVISTPGSYLLTGNLSVNCNKDGIDIQADNVVLDLGGFSIIGSGSAGAGIGINGGNRSNVSVKNGSVLNMPSGGIVLGASATITDVTASHTVSGDGIKMGDGIVRRVHADYNGSDGIEAIGTGSSTIEESEASNNSEEGIDIGDGAISATVASINGGSGVECSGCSIVNADLKANAGAGASCNGCTISNSNLSLNKTEGIVGSRAQITGNTVEINTGIGINVFQSSVVGNTVVANGGLGLEDSSNAANSVGNNYFSLNNGEQSPGGELQIDNATSIFISPNLCDNLLRTTAGSC